MKLNDALTFLGLAIIISTTIFLSFLYNIYVVNECTSSPLIYATKQYESLYNREFYGTLNFIPKPNEESGSIIHFNAYNISIEDPEWDNNWTHGYINLSFLDNLVIN